MAYDITDFSSLMELERAAPDVFLGHSPEYPWGGLYGGQVVAQALRAACATVETEHQVHSLHAYFIRGGDVDEPVRFEVDRIRDGRSFLTRRVVAHQSIGPILNLSASFQIREDEQADVQAIPLPEDLPDPDSLPVDDWSPILQRRTVTSENDGARAASWLKVTPPFGDDPVMHACALAYASDDMPTEAGTLSHPRRILPTAQPGEYERRFVGASLDHAIWFHRPARHDDWVLHDLSGQGVVGARGMALGKIFDRSGSHLATVAQEILLREKTR